MACIHAATTPFLRPRYLSRRACASRAAGALASAASNAATCASTSAWSGTFMGRTIHHEEATTTRVFAIVVAVVAPCQAGASRPLVLRPYLLLVRWVLGG